MGYPKITKLLKDEGWKVGTRIVQRLRRELGLAVPAKKPKKAVRSSLQACRRKQHTGGTFGLGTSFTTHSIDLGNLVYNLFRFKQPEVYDVMRAQFKKARETAQRSTC